MAPSVYIGCSIQDQIFDGLREVNAVFRDIEKQSDTVLAGLQTDMQQLSGTKTYAQATIGDVISNQVVWRAKTVGSAGNQISVEYAYQPPEFDSGSGLFVSVPAKSVVTGTVIRVYPAVNADGDVDPVHDTADNLAQWLTNTDITNLVTATLVGSGADVPIIVPATFLSGGQGAPLKDAENAANDIAKHFGQNSYQSLMASIDIPVVESAADAVAYLESLDTNYIIVNGKLLIVEGTNLQGLRVLYNLFNKNVQQMRTYLKKMAAATEVCHLCITENLANTQYEIICSVPTPVTVYVETFRGYDQQLSAIANKYTGGDVSQLNGYVFWIYAPKATTTNYKKLEYWGYDDLLIDDILAGEDPQVEDYIGDAQIPTVATITDPTILDVYGFSDAEVKELLDKVDVPGIRAPSQTDPADKAAIIEQLLQNNRALLPNGMRTKLKRPIIAPQAIDLSKTGNDENLAKELATRGRACARQSKNMRSKKLDLPSIGLSSAAQRIQDAANGNIFNNIPTIPKPNIPDVDLPNLPSADLPNVAKQVEAAFGAVSSVINTASKMFDRMVGSLLNVVKGVLNKLQNIMSLADNLLNNSLAKCLLGTSVESTGLPEAPSIGGGAGGAGGLGGITIGGIPIPMSLLGDALKELSDVLDATLTTAFETMMGLIEQPLCIVQSLLDDILGFDLGAALNPCKDGKDPNDECPPEETQDIINQSSEMTNVMNTLPQTDLYPTESTTKQVTDAVQEFTGVATKTVSTVANEITRGVQQVMSDVTKSLNAKMKTIAELDKAVRELLGETQETAINSEEGTQQEKGCAPAAIGLLSSAIVEFI